ncbi:MAG: hypothetical protein FWE25_10755 [Lachnospiraceae bacterium]|nr:hypothetical protein [Lachnospiraceae bacterium]
MEANRSDMIINGSGSFGGGTFKKVKVNGDATIQGDVMCDVLKVLGIGLIKGVTTADVFSVWGQIELNGTTDFKKASILGMAELNGNTVMSKAKITGQCVVNGNAEIEENKLLGSLEIKGDYKGNSATIKGELAVEGNVEVESFNSSGRFKIDGLLNGEEISINPRFASSFAKEIGGEKITICRKAEISLPFTSQGRVETEAIEGNEIYLEYTVAKVVRGTNIEIGPGCEIDLVECSGTYQVDETSVVKEKKNLGL